MSMDEGLPPAIPFLPSRVHQYDGGLIVLGMDGEVLLLGEELKPRHPHAKPFPMKISHSTVLNDRLYATWIDGELMMARMGCIPLDSAPKSGPPRADLRTKSTIEKAKHPEGNIWSHVLNSEPLALAANGEHLVFVLWRTGVYGLTPDADELWRMAEPTWNYPKKRPRNAETIALHLNEDSFTLTSRGGRIQRRSLATGALLEEFIAVGPEAPLEHHFKQGTHEIICSTTGELTWVHEGELLRTIKLNGPIQFASWDPTLEGWRIAGWREELLITATRNERHQWDEIPVHIEPVKGGALVLFNNGTWKNSPFEGTAPVNYEEE